MKNHTRIIEIGAEGGSITLYKYIDKKNEDWYYHSVSEMAYEDLELEGINKKSKHSMSIAEAFIKMQREYNNVFSLYPLFVHPEYKFIALALLEEYVNIIDEHINYYQWANVLEMEVEELKNSITKNDSRN
ncbi:hypothetical protein [Seonamhaeicola sp. ML3]|uniref:hypothetical protein n=1 Tax=Seonamhaeicola sp. ML3 TaxID=2937786 RepID=UPI00200C7EF9|nr:hypothetical protein [Seonamhaeicola sp. ML3]